jgi:hypothetical protein
MSGLGWIALRLCRNRRVRFARLCALPLGYFLKGHPAPKSTARAVTNPFWTPNKDSQERLSMT